MNVTMAVIVLSGLLAGMLVPMMMGLSDPWPATGFLFGGSIAVLIAAVCILANERHGGKEL